LQFYNTLSRHKEVFTPISDKEVKIYSCGPTVYSSPHIGNLRAYIFTDLLRRTLEFLGFTVIHVVNITDVGHLTSDASDGEDKLEAGARRENSTPLEIARKYEIEFREDLKKLNILTPSKLPRASEHISEQIELIKKLSAKEFTYITSDGIYFDTGKFQNYGKLSGQCLEEKEAGARVNVRSEKRNPADFALWKFCVGENENHILRWDFDGQPVKQNQDFDESEVRAQKIGFPGWHIECSAMSMKYLGEIFDIHTGGVDHIPVHHENEIAQSEAATGKKFVNFWLHNEFLTVDGGKMSKSLGNLFTITDLDERGFDPITFRYFCLGTHYRTKLNFTWDALHGAAHSLNNLRKIFQSLPAAEDPFDANISEFTNALADDLNSPQALAVVWKTAKSEVLSPAVKRATIAKFDEVLGLDLGRQETEIKLSEGQKRLLDEREEARVQKNWKRADEIRAEFAQQNIEVEDTVNGQIVKRKL